MIIRSRRPRTRLAHGIQAQRPPLLGRRRARPSRRQDPRPAAAVGAAASRRRPGGAAGDLGRAEVAEGRLELGLERVLERGPPTCASRLGRGGSEPAPAPAPASACLPRRCRPRTGPLPPLPPLPLWCCGRAALSAGARSPASESETLPCGSISSTRTSTSWPRVTTSSTRSTRLPWPSLEICTRPSRPGRMLTKAPNLVMFTTLPL